MALGDFDGRWKNPQGNSNELLYLWAQDLIKELRKGEYISNSIASGIANSELADMAQATIKGRAAGAGTGDPQDLTATQATAILNEFTGDSGGGGLKGLVKAPATGDAIKLLKGDATWVGGIVLLTSGTVTNQATLDIVLTAYAAYRGLTFYLTSWKPATDNINLLVRVSTNGGSSYDAGATDYKYASLLHDSTPTSAAGGSNGTTAITVGDAIGNGAAEGLDVILDLFAQTDTTIQPRILSRATIYQQNDNARGNHTSGRRVVAQDTDAIRFLFSSGNIASGKYAVYGLS
jgi:hypothetical protein